MLTAIGGGTGYLKAGFLGFAGSGKTHTAALLAIGVREMFGLDGPIAMFDTEQGSAYIEPMVMAATGKQLAGKRSRALSDLISLTEECQSEGAAVLIVDSITHVWREVCDAYLMQVNEVLRRKNRAEKTRLGFEDWQSIKAIWGQWPDMYLNSKLHIIICGRAGFEWDFEEREDARGEIKRELVKTGTKMKVEGEFGFEPSLLVEMERAQQREGGKLSKVFIRRATVLKDRFDAMDGEACDNPTFEFFLPHVRMLIPGAYAPVDVSAKTPMGVDDHAEDNYQRERRMRTILCEKIQGALLERWPGQTAREKRAKLDAIKDAFNTASWTEIETRLDSAALQRGLETIEAKGTPVAAEAE